MDFLNEDSYSRFELDGYEFTNVTSAVLSFKDKTMQHKFVGLLPSEARELADTIPNTKDWEWYYPHYRYRANLAKFEQNYLLRMKLKKVDIATIKDQNFNQIIRLVKQKIKHSEAIKEQEQQTHDIFQRYGIKWE